MSVRPLHTLGDCAENFLTSRVSVDQKRDCCTVVSEFGFKCHSSAFSDKQVQ